MLNTLSQKTKIRGAVFLVLLLTFLAVNFNWSKSWNQAASWLNLKLGDQGFFGREFRRFPEKPFKLGLDLQGGTHVVYEADVSELEMNERGEALNGVRDVIERRINLFGVAEPLVQIDTLGGHYRLIVELAGIKEVDQALQIIGETPYLEFKEERLSAETEEILEAQKNNERLTEDPYFQKTGLDGRMLKGAQVGFDQTTGQPEVNFELNEEGKKLFGEITKRNVGKRVAIYLDGVIISAPIVEEEISGGIARITGKFTIEEAKTLVRRLNAGALPVPINLVSQQTVGASLGRASLLQSLKAGIWGFLFIILFMMFYYRLPGLVAGLALGVYCILLLALFKFIPVTLTLSGIAGFILSVGMAVDANVLIFERLREELRAGRNLNFAISEAFKRAWSSIRDGNVSTLITAAILYWVGVSFVKGFALTLSFGILVSMFTAIIFTRQILMLLAETRLRNFVWLWKGGLKKD